MTVLPSQVDVAHQSGVKIRFGRDRQMGATGGFHLDHAPTELDDRQRLARVTAGCTAGRDPIVVDAGHTEGLSRDWAGEAKAQSEGAEYVHGTS